MCSGELPNSRHRKYCSASCRNRYSNQKRSKENVIWQRKRREEIAKTPSDRKVQCLVCGLWYVQLCTHTVQVHGMTGREYREHFKLEVKKGVVPKWYKKKKGDQALENKTYKNLENGAKFRFVEGDTKAGRYKRSPITLERLKNLHKLNKK